MKTTLPRQIRPLYNHLIIRNLYNRRRFDLREPHTSEEGKDFADQGYDKYRIPIIRIVGRGGLHNCPATALFEGVPIRVFGAGVGILALEKINKKRMYLDNAYTDHKQHDPRQPLLTIAAAFYLYNQFNTVNGTYIPHNELRITQPDFIPCITDLSKIPAAKEFAKKNNHILSLQSDPCFYDVNEGKFYHIEDGKKSDQLILPRDVLTIENMRHDQEMRQFVNRQYWQEVLRFVDWVLKENHGLIPEEFLSHEQNDNTAESVLKLFISDVMSLLKPKSKNTPHSFEALTTSLKEKNNSSQIS